MRYHCGSAALEFWEFILCCIKCSLYEGIIAAVPSKAVSKTLNNTVNILCRYNVNVIDLEERGKIVEIATSDGRTALEDGADQSGNREFLRLHIWSKADLSQGRGGYRADG